MQQVDLERSQLDLESLISRYAALVQIAEHEVSTCKQRIERLSCKLDPRKLAREQKRLAQRQAQLVTAQQKLHYAKQLKQVSAARSNAAQLLADVARRLNGQE